MLHGQLQNDRIHTSPVYLHHEPTDWQIHYGCRIDTPGYRSPVVFFPLQTTLAGAPPRRYQGGKRALQILFSNSHYDCLKPVDLHSPLVAEEVVRPVKSGNFYFAAISLL